MQSRRNILAAIAVAPIALMSVSSSGAPPWDVADWAKRWTTQGGTMMLHGDDLQIAFRPEDIEALKPLMREFKNHPAASKEAKQFMRDRGLDGYSFGLPGAGARK